MLSFQLWISILLILWICLLWSRRRLYQLMVKFPGPMGYPLIGSLYRFWCTNEFLTEICGEIKKYGPTWLGWFGPSAMLFVSDPQLNQELLTSPATIQKNRVTKDVLGEILGDGLLALDVSPWMRHRKALNPAFANNVLLSFFPIFNAETGNLLKKLDDLLGKGETNLLSLFKNYTLAIATQTTMGCDVKQEQVYQNGSIMQSYQCALESSTRLFLSPWLNNKLMRHLTGLEEVIIDTNKKIRSLIKKMIDRNMDSDAGNTDSSQNRNPTFIRLAIGQLRDRIFSYREVEDEANTIVFAAFETTAITLYYTLVLLAMFPEYQERVYEEIKSVFPNGGDFEVSYEDIQKLQYLELVLNESLRLMPPIPLTLRKLTQDVKLSTGVELPKGLQICISIFHTHRNEEVWGPHAANFNPDNFLPENIQNKHPFAFLPFLRGKRNCIGWKYALMSLKVTLVKILRNYKLSTSFRFQDLVIVNNISLKLKEEPLLKLERRD